MLLLQTLKAGHFICSPASPKMCVCVCVCVCVCLTGFITEYCLINEMHLTNPTNFQVKKHIQQDAWGMDDLINQKLT